MSKLEEDMIELTLRLVLWAMLQEYVGEVWLVHPSGMLFDDLRLGEV